MLSRAKMTCLQFVEECVIREVFNTFLTSKPAVYFQRSSFDGRVLFLLVLYLI